MASNSIEQKETSPSICIDRLVLSIVLNPYYYKGKGERKIRAEDIEHFNYMVGMLYASERLTHSNQYKKGAKGGKPIPQRHYLKKDGRLLMDIMHGCQYGKYFFQIGINAGRLKDEDYPIIVAELTGLLPPGHSVRKLLLHSEVTRLELCIDLPYVEPDEITVLAMGNKTHTQFEGSTEYNGTRQSRLCVVKYDKRKQLLEKEGIDIGHALTRIEIRVQERRKSAYDFVEMGEVDFYQNLFRRPFLAVRCHMPTTETSAAGESGKPTGQAGTFAASIILQNQEALSPQAAYALLVQALRGLGAATPEACRDIAQDFEHST